MVKAISLQDYYNRLEAFYDPDPMIRIAAIHHAGGKLDRNARLRQTLKDLLDDKDRLVARYAALRLAQSGDTSGLHHLVQAISRAQGQDREELDGCLRNCTRFPFAVVLNERLYLETIPAVKDEGYREVLKKALELTSDDFYEKSEQDTSFRDTFLKIMRSLDRVDGLRVRDGSVLDVGWVLSVPMGKQPGFLFCPDRRLFLKFQEESILNRVYIERGRQVLFVANETGSRSEADCLYVFEDIAPRQEQLKNLLTPEAMTAFARQSRLLPGVVAYKHESHDRVDLPGVVAYKHELPDRVDLPGVVADKHELPDRVDVLCANGSSFQEVYRAQRAFIGQFVLIEVQTEMGRPQCHFVPGLQLHPTVIRRIVFDYADFNKMVLAQVTAIHDATHPKTGLSRCIVRTEKGEEVTTYIRAPREGSRVLMKPCHVCKGLGATPCQGEFRCFRCKGTGTLTDGRDCLLCKCRYCKGNRLVFHSKVNCHYE